MLTLFLVAGVGVCWGGGQSLQGAAAVFTSESHVVLFKLSDVTNPLKIEEGLSCV